jgi:hypothetical protein
MNISVKTQGHLFIQMDRTLGIFCSKRVIEQQQAPPIYRITSCVNDENQLHYEQTSKECTKISLYLYQKRLMHTIFCTIRFWYITDAVWWRDSLRHRATSLKVADSIPHGVIGICHRHNRSGRTMALRSTQSLTEMSTRNIFLGVKAAGA